MSTNLHRITASAITAALVFVVTWTVRIPIPATSGGYLNFGDVIIFISAYLLGGPVSAIASAIGSALADTAAASVIYVPGTFVIKGLMGLVCGLLSTQRKFTIYAGSCILGGAIMTLGYALYETAVFGFAYAISSVPFNLLQWAGSSAAAIVLFPVIKRLSKALNLDFKS